MEDGEQGKPTEQQLHNLRDVLRNGVISILWARAVTEFKIEVFNVLQTLFGPSKQPFKTQPRIENADIT